MSTTQIVFTFKLGAVLTNVTSAVFSDPTGAFGVRRIDTGAVVVADGTALVWQSLGVYAYTFTDPAPGLTYNYWVEFVYSGNTYRIEQDISGSTDGSGGGATTSCVDYTMAIPAQDTLLDEASAIWLPEYARYIGLDECGIMGVRVPGNTDECGDVWEWHERRILVDALAAAQSEIEDQLRYTLTPQWFTERNPYQYHYLTRWHKVIAGGVKGVTNISLGQAVGHGTDPAVVGPIATALTDIAEIHVYHPGTDIEIIPSLITIAAGNLTIYIPRCRLLAEPNLNVSGGADYTNTTLFESTVDVKRVYNDISTNATLIYPHTCTVNTCGCNCGCSGYECTCGCTEATEAGCIYIRDGEAGKIDISPATYAAGTWTSSSSCRCYAPEFVTVNYYAGFDYNHCTSKDRAYWYRLREAVIRLAHSRMPLPTCECRVLREKWAADQLVPDNMPQERLLCPFGEQAGAWRAWQIAKGLKIYRLGVL